MQIDPDRSEPAQLCPTCGAYWRCEHWGHLVTTNLAGSDVRELTGPIFEPSRRFGKDLSAADVLEAVHKLEWEELQRQDKDYRAQGLEPPRYRPFLLDAMEPPRP